MSKRPKTWFMITSEAAGSEVEERIVALRDIATEIEKAIDLNGKALAHSWALLNKLGDLGS